MNRAKKRFAIVAGGNVTAPPQSERIDVANTTVKVRKFGGSAGTIRHWQVLCHGNDKSAKFPSGTLSPGPQPRTGANKDLKSKSKRRSAK